MSDRHRHVKQYVVALDLDDPAQAVAAAVLDKLLELLSGTDDDISSDKYTAVCPICGEQFYGTTKANARRAVGSHKRKCEGRR